MSYFQTTKLEVPRFTNPVHNLADRVNRTWLQWGFALTNKKLAGSSLDPEFGLVIIQTLQITNCLFQKPRS